MVWVSGRAGRNTWVTVGPGMLAAMTPFLIIYYLSVWPFVAVIRAIVRRRRRRRQPPPRLYWGGRS